MRPMPAWAKAAAARRRKAAQVGPVSSRGPLSRRSGNGRRPSNGRSRNRSAVWIRACPRPLARQPLRVGSGPASSTSTWTSSPGRLSLMQQRALPAGSDHLARHRVALRKPRHAGAAQHSSHGAFGHPAQEASWAGPQRCFRRAARTLRSRRASVAEANDESARTVLESGQTSSSKRRTSDGRIGVRFPSLGDMGNRHALISNPLDEE